MEENEPLTVAEALIRANADTEEVMAESGLSYNAVVSIRSRMFRDELKNFAHHDFAHSTLVSLLQRYRDQPDVTVIELAASVRVSTWLTYPPVLLLRLVMSRHYKLAKDTISRYLESSSSVEDARLANDIQMCVENDPYSSPYTEHIKRFIGEEHEYLLEASLRNAGIPFVNEEDMRTQKRQHKTPDVKLNVPISVDGRLVSWVESKAMYGDEQTFAEHLSGQLDSYTNAIGPGMVIYWFGCVESIKSNPNIFVCDDFPHITRIKTLQSLARELMPT